MDVCVCEWSRPLFFFQITIVQNLYEPLETLQALQAFVAKKEEEEEEEEEDVVLSCTNLSQLI